MEIAAPVQHSNSVFCNIYLIGLRTLVVMNTLTFLLLYPSHAGQVATLCTLLSLFIAG